MNYQSVSQAIERGGSIRAAAKLLGMSYTAVQWWIRTNGYKVDKRACLVQVMEPVKNANTEDALAVVSTPEARQMVETR